MKFIDKDLNYGREIIVKWIREYIGNQDINQYRYLDVGFGKGMDFFNIKKSFSNGQFEFYALDYYKPNLDIAVANRVKSIKIDIERNRLPFQDEVFDIIIANQIIEHTKEIFWIFSEFSRIIKKNGLLIIGVPNLASLHNRLLLLLGKQPTCIRVLGPHVRAFTEQSFIDFVQFDNFFKVLDTAGSNFYPFPPLIGKFLSKLFPRFSVGIFFKIIRTEKSGEFIEVLDKNFFETNYFRG